MKSSSFSSSTIGFFVKLVIPFTLKSKLDYSAFTKIIDFYILTGVHGFLVEKPKEYTYQVSDQELLNVIEFIKSKTGSSIPIFVQIEDVLDLKFFTQYDQHKFIDGYIIKTKGNYKSFFPLMIQIKNYISNKPNLAIFMSIHENKMSPEFLLKTKTRFEKFLSGYVFHNLSDIKTVKKLRQMEKLFNIPIALVLGEDIRFLPSFMRAGINGFYCHSLFPEIILDFLRNFYKDNYLKGYDNYLKIIYLLNLEKATSLSEEIFIFIFLQRGILKNTPFDKKKYLENMDIFLEIEIAVEILHKQCRNLNHSYSTYLLKETSNNFLNF